MYLFLSVAKIFQSFLLAWKIIPKSERNLVLLVKILLSNILENATTC